MSWEREAGDLAGAAGAGTGVLASDADRDRIAALLGEAFAEGTLTAGEHGERVRAAYEARNRAELARLIADLPAPADGSPGQPAAVPVGMDHCLLCALLICCPPVGIAWLLAARRRSRPGRGQPLALAGLRVWAEPPAQRSAGDALRPTAAASGGGRGAEDR